jgi:DNA mismatch repair protein MutL
MKAALSTSPVNRVRLLPEQVANQIAAGEVVERPASVVKELVENALDAGATRVMVEIQAGGRSLIRVTDDGIGMNRDDALLCLERHATSKIQRAEDLSAIRTMGFRGEALPSIASVGRMILTTRERDGSAVAATQVVIHGGKILEVREAGAPTGTCVELRQLFFNLPARRRFLRSEETEFAHIQHYLTLAALSHPGVGFTFIKDTRTFWQLPAIPRAEEIAHRIDALRQRVRGLFGNEEKLLEVDFTAELSGTVRANESEEEPLPEPSNQFKLWGLMGHPGVSRSTREDQYLFVNSRPVENRGLNFALVEGYHTALMKGQYPVCCLFVEIDPALVDVNIHPSKREVKFHNERAVRQLTTQAVRDTLLAFHGGTSKPSLAEGIGHQLQPVRPSTSSIDAAAAAPLAPAPRVLPGFTALTGTPLDSRREPASGSTAATGPMGTGPMGTGPVESDQVYIRTEGQEIDLGVTPEQVGAGVGQIVENRPSDPRAGSVRPNPLLSVPLRLVGVIGRLYVVLESDRGLVLMDQHAAHERILFEQMLERVESGAVPSQRLLLPETVELSARDADFLRQQLSTLNRLGVGLSEFGERTFLLDAVPPMVKLKEARRFVVELADELKAAGQSINAQRLGEDTIAKTVCRHAVKANDPLSGPELEKLVDDLRHCAMPYTCPHGRPTLIEMGYRELEKKFGRLA